MKIRIKDIAEKAGVSVGTVDRVLHERGEVSKITREKILKIVEELNYEPDILASTLASKRSFRFAVLIPLADENNRFWVKPLTGLDDALAEIKHFSVHIELFPFNQDSRDSFLKKANEVVSFAPDGVLLAPVFSGEALKFSSQLAELKIPFVFINSNIPGTNSIAYVGQSGIQSGAVAAKLMQFGLHAGELAIVNIVRDKLNHNHLLQRAKGFKAFFNFDTPPAFQIHEVTVNDGDKYQLMNDLEKFLQVHPSTRGIFVTNSKVYKISSYYKLKDSKVKPVIIGYDLLPENQQLLKEGLIDFLISQKPEEQAYRGVMSLFNHIILKKNVEKEQFLPIDIITRENIEYYI